MKPGYLLSLSVIITLAAFVAAPAWPAALIFSVSTAAFVISEILVPSKEVPTKADFNQLRANIEAVETRNKLEADEIRKAISDLGTQLKGTANKLTGLRMEIGLRDN